MKYTRVELARRLLGVATQLFIDNKDPISVHCLASSAAEHASYLAKKSGKNVFNDHILETFSKKSRKDIRKIRNRVWNSIKHAYENNGSPKDLESELKGFSDETNDHALFVVWYDFARSGQPLPIAAQVFQVWYFELHPEKLNSDHVRDVGRTNEFGNIREVDRAEQKNRLKSAVSKHSSDINLMKDPKTDPRPLVLE